MPVLKEEFTFPSVVGDADIHAISWKPEGPAKAVLQLVHGPSVVGVIAHTHLRLHVPVECRDLVLSPAAHRILVADILHDYLYYGNTKRH